MSVDADTLGALGLLMTKADAAPVLFARRSRHDTCRGLASRAPHDAAVVGAAPFAGVWQARVGLNAHITRTGEAAGWMRSQKLVQRGSCRARRPRAVRLAVARTTLTANAQRKRRRDRELKQPAVAFHVLLAAAA